MSLIKKQHILVLALMFSGVFIVFTSMASEVNVCTQLNEKATREQVRIDTPKRLYVITGKGRTHFNSAPDKKCEIKDLFLVRDDQVQAYGEYENFINVTYFNLRGEDTTGWIDASLIKETGLGEGPSSDEQTAFAMVPTLINTNKLTNLQSACLEYDYSAKDPKYLTVKVSKKSGTVECGEDKKLPFTIIINRRDRSAYSDAGNESSVYTPLSLQ